MENWVILCVVGRNWDTPVQGERASALVDSSREGEAGTSYTGGHKRGRSDVTHTYTYTDYSSTAATKLKQTPNLA